MGLCPKSQGRERTNSSSCEAAVLAKPKARLCEPWETMPVLISGACEAGDISVSSSEFEFRVRTNATAPLSDWSPLRGSRKFCLLVTQGSQSLALGLTTTAASQLVEYCKLHVA